MNTENRAGPEARFRAAALEVEKQIPANAEGLMKRWPNISREEAMQAARLGTEAYLAVLKTGLEHMRRHHDERDEVSTVTYGLVTVTYLTQLALYAEDRLNIAKHVLDVLDAQRGERP